MSLKSFDREIHVLAWSGLGNQQPKVPCSHVPLIVRDQNRQSDFDFSVLNLHHRLSRAPTDAIGTSYMNTTDARAVFAGSIIIPSLSVQRIIRVSECVVIW